ncbi:MAG: DUF1861 family protein [Candidatus Woesearchaeota archaeon]
MEECSPDQPRHISELVDEYEGLMHPDYEVEEVRFEGIPQEHYGYNSTSRFFDNPRPGDIDIFRQLRCMSLDDIDKEYQRVASRIEKDFDERGSRVMFFSPVNSHWQIVPDAPIFERMQDPHITWVTRKAGGKEFPRLVFIPVQTYDKFDEGFGPEVGYGTRVFEGDSVNGLEDTGIYVHNSKDIRLKQSPWGWYFLGTRPEKPYNNKKGDELIRKYIAWDVFTDLDDLPHRLHNPRFSLENMLRKEEWAGIDDILFLEHKKWKIGLLLHLGYEQPEHIKHYAEAAMMLDPITGDYKGPWVINTRRDYPVKGQKILREDRMDTLKDVLLFGNCWQNGSPNTLHMHYNASDRFTLMMTRESPFPYPIVWHSQN